jgi:hypothetical protein
VQAVLLFSILLFILLLSTNIRDNLNVNINFTNVLNKDEINNLIQKSYEVGVDETTSAPQNNETNAITIASFGLFPDDLFDPYLSDRIVEQLEHKVVQAKRTIRIYLSQPSAQLQNGLTCATIHLLKTLFCRVHFING